VGGSSRSSRRRQTAATQPRPYGGSREQVLRRLARMEGQVRGVARMVERDEDCVDVLQQTAALRAAVDSVSMLLMEDHVHDCVNSAVKSGDVDALTDSVMDVVRRGMGRPARSGTSRSSSEG
jgi:DNA-binding FrmR family transcriptional regulator